MDPLNMNLRFSVHEGLYAVAAFFRLADALLHAEQISQQRHDIAVRVFFHAEGNHVKLMRTFMFIGNKPKAV